MKNYIRTKDGIYEVVGFDDECIIPSPIIKMNGKLTHCSGYKNCKQADIIEELCDEFVYCYRDDMPILVNEEQIKQIILVDRIQDVRGAIWTDKGLIYVAEMNEDGVLCLI